MPNLRYTISTDSSRFDVEMIHQFLTNCYLAEGVPREIVLRSIENAMCFGAFDGDKQVGFARVITDRATYAYVGDVFILKSHRGSRALETADENHHGTSRVEGLRRWSLVTNDAHALYRQFGFTTVANPQRYLEIVNPDVYQRKRH